MTAPQKTSVVNGELQTVEFADDRFRHPGTDMALVVRYDRQWNGQIKLGYWPVATNVQGRPAFYVVGSKDLPERKPGEPEIDFLLRVAEDWFEELAPQLESEHESMDRWARRFGR